MRGGKKEEREAISNNHTSSPHTVFLCSLKQGWGVGKFVVLAPSFLYRSGSFFYVDLNLSLPHAQVNSQNIFPKKNTNGKLHDFT